MRNISEIDSMAVNYRRELGEDSMSPIDIFRIAKTMNNLTTVWYPFGDHISGMCINGNHTQLIAINSEMSLGRQRFSLAHEFYHLRYDSNNSKNVCPIAFNRENENEIEADIFASHFLLPSAAFYRELENQSQVTEELVILLEQRYGLSRQAMLYRLKEEKKISNHLYNEMQSNVQYSAAKHGYDTDLYMALPMDNNMKTTGQYIRLADKLYKNEIISTGKYEELLLDAFRTDLVYGEDKEDVIID